MNLPIIPLILIVGVLIIYLVWKVMSPAKKKPVQRRFSIHKYRKKRRNEEEDE